MEAQRYIFLPNYGNFSVTLHPQNQSNNTITTITHMYNLAIIPMFLNNLGGWEWIIILLVILLLFGGKKIPELMRGLGKGVKSFKQGMNEVKEEIEKEENPSKK